jgi:uncharacterized protein YaaQ
MKKFFFLVIISFVFSACAPTTVSAPEPIFYKDAKENLFPAVVQAISTSSGLDNSTGWAISESDSEGGFIRATTSVRVCGFLGLGCHDEVESVSVVISQADNNRTQIVIQRTPKAQTLAERIRKELDSKFLRS